MSEPISESKEKPARPLNRWGIGTLSVLQVVLLAIALIALNYLSMHHYARKDMSRSSDFTISSATTRYLTNPPFSDRARPVKWIMAIRRVSPFYDRVRALAEEYVRHSNGKIEMEVVDPLRSADRMQEVSAAYGITLARDLIIIDARNDDSPVVTEDANKIKSLNPNVKLALVEDMGVFTIVEDAQDRKRQLTSEDSPQDEPGTRVRTRKLTAFQCEDVLTARLVEAIEGKPRKMALLTDKSGIGDEDSAIRKSLVDLMRFQNVELVDLHLAETSEIPEDISGLVLAAPKYDLTEKELATLESYWNKPRSALLVMIDTGDTPPKLRAFLRNNGVTPRKDRVITREKEQLVTSARGVFTKNIQFTKDLAGLATDFGGATSSLEVREDAEELQNRGIRPMPLIEAPATFWGETKFGQGKEAFNEIEDFKPPLFLAASVIRGDEADDRFAADTSRMVVISNVDFIDPKHHKPSNLDFLASSVNWLVGRESLAGIGPRSLRTYKLPILDAQVSFINRVNLFFLPASLILIGAFVWSSRRA